MEDTLRALKRWHIQLLLGLNPCFNGRYSQSHKGGVGKTTTTS